MISKARSAIRLLRIVPPAIVAWHLVAPPAWAQAEPPAGTSTKSYVLPYILVILVTALGLLVVLRPSPRKSGNRPKAEG
jgi:hypothetical protein